jgi:tetratricopeptide (TPR) repeat protein
MAKAPQKEGKEQPSGLEKAWGKFKKRDFEGALNLFEELLEENETEDALFGRACALFRNDEPEDAIKDLNTLLKKNPENLQALHTRALVYGMEEKYKEASRDLERVLEIEPASVEAWCDLGGAWLVSKEYAKANDCFDRGIDIDKSCPDAWFGKGMVALEKKEYKRAIEYLNAAIKLDGKYLLALLARAEAWLMLNQKKEAASDVVKILALEPTIFTSGDAGTSDENYNSDDDDEINDDDDLDSYKLDD